MGDHFLEAELAEAKDVIPTIEGCTLIACVSAQVRVSYRYRLARLLNKTPFHSDLY